MASCWPRPSICVLVVAASSISTSELTPAAVIVPVESSAEVQSPSASLLRYEPLASIDSQAIAKVPKQRTCVQYCIAMSTCLSLICDRVSSSINKNCAEQLRKDWGCRVAQIRSTVEPVIMNNRHNE